MKCLHFRAVLAIWLLGCVLPLVSAAPPKPRLVVLTDISPIDVEPDDTESLIRLLVHADLFEIEALIATTGWSSSGGHPEWIKFIEGMIDAYEKDLPNLRKRSNQTGHLADESRQEIGYWPSPEYLRSKTVVGSQTRGMKFVGSGNDSPGSKLIQSLVDEPDDRPIWVLAWGGANTLAQSLWRLREARSPTQFRSVLGRFRVYAITDQDRGYEKGTPFDDSSHVWMRREFEGALRFLWDESAWMYQNGTGKSQWERYAAEIQGRGHLGDLYPKYRYGVEGDTPSFLYLLPNGLNDPENPGHGGWGGYFEWGIGPDRLTRSFVNQAGTAAHAISRKYEARFYPAIFNDFVARMRWAKSGAGNRNPVVKIGGDDGLEPIRRNPRAGDSMVLDASETRDPDGDKLTFSWWVLSEAGTYTNTVRIAGAETVRATIEVPPDSVGREFHVICEVTDDGEPPLTSYRRILVHPTEPPAKTGATSGPHPPGPRPRVVVMSDFPPLDVIPGGAGEGPAWKRSDPDDIQSMVRFLLYANEFDVEGLIATAGTFANVARRQGILDLLDLYDQVDENLRKHDTRFPTADRLRAVTWQGRDGTWGQPVELVVGTGRDSEASEAIVRIVDREDPRPVWICVWGGPGELAQAIWKVRETRGAAGLERFLGKLRVYLIGLGDKPGQDGSGQWLLDQFPKLFVIVSRTTYAGMFAQGTPIGNLAWLNTHVREGHGPLGAVYPRSGFDPKHPGQLEGDTPSFLYLYGGVAGRSDLENPDQESWGGRYVQRDASTRHWFDGSGPASVSKWLPEIQADFARRADWMLP